MSGIAAVIRFDGGPIEPGTVEAMTAAMHYRGVDGIAHWSDGQAALGHCMLHTTAESLEEKQPLASEDGNRVLVFHGWLSNPEEVRSDLLARGVRLRDRSDAELVLRAYEVWGDDCPHRIDGEFAFLVWDKVRQEAFLARDHMGLKSLHYCWDGKRLVVATDIVGVLAVPGIEAVPNRGKIAEYLSFEFTEQEETIWQSVFHVPAAHSLRLGANGMRRKKYWQPPFEISVRYQRDEDYIEHYRDMFSDSVRRASRTHLPLACDVSGGLDSSSIFAMAHDLRRKGNLLANDIKGYSWYFKDALGSPADEIGFARAVAKHVGGNVREVEPFLPDLGWFVECGRQDRDIAGYPNAAMAISTGRALTGDGCRVLLGGSGGDECLRGTSFHLSELIDEQNWSALYRELRDIAAEEGLGQAAWQLFRFGLAHRIPKPLLAARRNVLSRRLRQGVEEKNWISPELRSLLHQRHTLRDTDIHLGIRSISRRSMYMTLNDPFAPVIRNQLSRHSARLGYEMRSPMYSRNFIEFAFATPDIAKFRNGTTKFTHRRALSELLPSEVTNRDSKSHFTLAFDRYLQGHSIETMARILRESRSGHLETQNALKLLEHYRRNPDEMRWIWPLWGMLAIESLF